MIDAIAALANRFWSIHPNEIPPGITREQFYEREMRALTTQAADRIEQLEARLDRAVTRGLEQVERIATLEAALREIENCNKSGLLIKVNAMRKIARAALAPEQDK